LSRGDRSRSERTSEERERDREERERRRAARGGPPPAADDSAPALEPPEPSHLDPVESEPLPVDPARAEPIQVEPVHVEPIHVEPVPVEPVEVEPLPVEPVEVEPLPVEPIEAEPVQIEPAQAEPVYVAPAHVEPAEVEPVPVEPVHGRSSQEEPPPSEPEAVEAVETAEPIEAPIEADPEPEPEPPVSERPRRLPAPPRRVDDGPSPRARRRAGASVAAGGAPRPRAAARGGMSAIGSGSGGRRSSFPVSRLVAVIALVLVAGAVVLVVHSLKSSKSKPATSASLREAKILIPEGKTRLQIALIAQKAGLTGSYRSAAKRSALLDPTQYGAPKGTPDLEGFLFPATYDVIKGSSVSRLVSSQLEAFHENFSSEDAARAKALNVTPYQLLIVASMIEREAQVPGDRAKIAAVIYNRLKERMPLGIDAAIYYAVEMEKGVATYTGELTESQLKINSPYNTRTHTGLPPTPISNPGVASIQAAAHPTHASYLYYVAGADGCGEQVFSDTQAAFEVNVAAYEAAKRKNGGHPPKCKH
jgi:cell division protein YceG involved in septum cleavage